MCAQRSFTVLPRRTANNLPRTVNALRAWLRGSEEGQTLFRELASGFLEEKCRACQQIRPSRKVLVVLRRLGCFPGAEVYAETGVHVRVLELPDVPDDGPFTEWTERLMELDLPKSWKHILWVPERQVKRDVFRGVTVEKALRFHEELMLIRALRNH